MSKTNTNDGVELIQVKTRFQSSAKRSGGMTATQAVSAAEAEVENLGERYLEELAQDIEQLDRLFVELRRATTDRHGEVLLEIFEYARRVHDLGRTFGYDLVTDVAARMCDLIHRLCAANVQSIEELAVCLNALKHVSARDFKGVRATDSRVLLSGLDKVVDRYAPVSTDSEH